MGMTVEHICALLPVSLSTPILSLGRQRLFGLREIRLRLGCPPLLWGDGRPGWFSPGKVICDAPMLTRAVLALGGGSEEAVRDELSSGFLPLAGGHRVGVCGRAVQANGSIRTLRDITSLNIRIHRFVPDAARPIEDQLFTATGAARSLLILSAPGRGKTTMLCAAGAMLAKRCVVGAADERGELRDDLIASGGMVDVISLCSKAAAIEMLVRSMGPQVILCDELGEAADAAAVRQAALQGCAVVATAHGTSLSRMPKAVVELIHNNIFETVVLLAADGEVGRVAGIYAGEELK